MDTVFFQNNLAVTIFLFKRGNLESAVSRRSVTWIIIWFCF